MKEQAKPLAMANLHYLRQSPHKVRLVADMVRGRRVADAMAILSFSKKRAAADLLQLLRSAVANLQQKEDAVYDEERLCVSRLFVDGGPTMRRFRAMSMGRAGMRRKRTSHIHIELTERGAKGRAAAKPKASGAAPGTSTKKETKK